MNKLIISLPLFVMLAAAFSIALLFVYYNAAYGQATTTGSPTTGGESSFLSSSSHPSITFVQFGQPVQQQTVEERFTNLLLDLNQTSEWKAHNIMVNESQTGLTAVMLSSTQNTTWVESRIDNVTQTYGFDLLLYDFLYGKYPTIVIASQPEQQPQQPVVEEVIGEEEVTEVETTTTTTEEEETGEVTTPDEEEVDNGGDDGDNNDNGGDSDNEGGPLDEQVQDIEDLFDEDPNNDPPCQGSSCEEFEDLFGSNNNESEVE
jgi:hypothetical protein